VNKYEGAAAPQTPWRFFGGSAPRMPTQKNFTFSLYIGIYKQISGYITNYN